MRILVVDDHALIRVGLRHLLALAAPNDPEFEMLEAGSCCEALEIAGAAGRIDLVLLDLHLSDCTGLVGLDRFVRARPDLPVLAISSIDDPATIRAVLQRGAAGYIPKTCMNQVLLSAVRLVLAGGVYIPPDALLTGGERMPELAKQGGPAGAAAMSADSISATAAALGLTERQAEVMRLLAEGRSNKEIARTLNVAATTVKGHVAIVLRALKVPSRTQAILALVHYRDGGAPLRQKIL